MQKVSSKLHLHSNVHFLHNEISFIKTNLTMLKISIWRLFLYLIPQRSPYLTYTFKHTKIRVSNIQYKLWKYKSMKIIPGFSYLKVVRYLMIYNFTYMIECYNYSKYDDVKIFFITPDKFLRFCTKHENITSCFVWRIGKKEDFSS